MENINWIAMLIATLIPMIAGFAWYHKALFGKGWQADVGLSDDQIASANMGKVMGISLVMAFMIAIFMTGFCNGIGQEGGYDTFKHGMAHGAIVGVFGVLPIFVTNGLFEQRPWRLIFTNAFYWIVVLMLVGGVVDSMHHWPNA